MELLAKSQSLEERAVQESQAAAEMKQQFQDILQRRLHLALHTPLSGLTAAEASVILQDLNQTADVTENWSPLAILRNSVLSEIDVLGKAESAFLTAQKADSQAQDVYRDTVQRRVQNVEELSAAIAHEDAARRAWVAAQEQVQNCRKALVDTTRALAQAEIHAKKSDYELELQQVQLERQAEKVRKVLKQKEQKVRQVKEQELWLQQQGDREQQPSRSKATQVQQHRQGPVMYNDNVILRDAEITAHQLQLDDAWYYEDDDSPERHQALQELRQEERLLQEASQRLELMAARLLSRAHKLRQRAQELDGTIYVNDPNDEGDYVEGME